MKKYNNILEAINRGIKLALDDYEDNVNLPSSKSNIIKNIDTKELWDLHNQFVDLGLPSGTLWAAYNLGCDIKYLNNTNPKETRPEDWYGNYYSWGEIKPKNNYLERYYKLAYKVNLVSGYSVKKYNIFDKIITLELCDDAAVQNDIFNTGQKMPTAAQIDELIENTTYKFVENYLGCIKLSGCLLTSKINGKILFIPAAGRKLNKKNQPWGLDNFGAFWSSERPSIINTTGAYALIFNKNMNVLEADDSYRFSGFNVRPVLNR